MLVTDGAFVKSPVACYNQHTLQNSKREGGATMKICTKARILRAREYERMEVFAKVAGISPSRWKFFERAQGALPVDCLERAADILGVRVEDLADSRGFPVGV